MYFSDLKIRKRMIRLSVIGSILMVLVTNRYYTIYRADLHSSRFDFPYIEIKLLVSLLITIALVFFTYRTLQKN